MHAGTCIKFDTGLSNNRRPTRPAAKISQLQTVRLTVSLKQTSSVQRTSVHFAFFGTQVHTLLWHHAEAIMFTTEMSGFSWLNNTVIGY